MVIRSTADADRYTETVRHFAGRIATGSQVRRASPLPCFGAETFAAVRPRNNGKMAIDLAKLANRPESHRYVFFLSPTFPGKVRLPKFEQNIVQIWSVDVEQARPTRRHTRRQPPPSQQGQAAGCPT